MLVNKIKKKIYSNLNKIIKLRKYKHQKKDKSFVSKADILIEKIVEGVLIKNLKKDFFLISEEKYSKNKEIKDSKYLIILDPIDGTENFVSGIPIWGISICVYKENKHKESMILMPEMNLEIKSGKKIIKNYSRIIGLSSSNNKILKKISNLNEIRILGCCVYNMYNVIHGNFKSYSNPKANTWDILAGINIALENNMFIRINGREYNGEILYPNKKYNIEVRY